MQQTGKKIIIKQTNGKTDKTPRIQKKYQDKFGVLLYGYVSFYQYAMLFILFPVSFLFQQ